MTRTVCGRCEMDKCQCKTIRATAMTRDDIIQMAWEAGFQVLLPQDHVDGTGGVYVVEDEIAGMLERFAALVAAEKDKEIERLRKVLKKLEYFSDGTIRRYPTESEVEAARQEQPK